MAAPKPIFYPSENLIAGLSHFAWGFMLVWLFAPFGLFKLGAALALSFAAVKEYIFDTFVEKATQLDNTVDFAEYVGGIILATVVYYFASR